VSDEALVARLKDRDEDAYREVLARFSDPLYRYLYGVTGDMQLSQDLLGDTFLRVVEQIDRYPYQGAPFKAWLYRVAHNLALNALKRDRHTVSVPDLEQTVRPVTDPALRIAAQLEEVDRGAAAGDRAALCERAEPGFAAPTHYV
jgi:RNA polymerase sigma-70 factor (ECF subfamily)